MRIYSKIDFFTIYQYKYTKYTLYTSKMFNRNDRR